MGEVGKTERTTQNRIIKLFVDELRYHYLGNWEREARSIPIEEALLKKYLKSTSKYSPVLIEKAIEKLIRAASKVSDGLYEANHEVYQLLRYGITVREQLGKQKQTVFPIDWKTPENNHFGVAEEVSFLGKHTKRPDVVMYVNGIALGVLELK